MGWIDEYRQNLRESRTARKVIFPPGYYRPCVKLRAWREEQCLRIADVAEAVGFSNSSIQALEARGTGSRFLFECIEKYTGGEVTADYCSRLRLPRKLWHTL